MAKQTTALLFLIILSVDGAQLSSSSTAVACALSRVLSQRAAGARTSKVASITCLGPRSRRLGNWLSWNVRRVGPLPSFHVDSGPLCLHRDPPEE